MPPRPLYATCIRRAAQLLGGYSALGARLRISPRLLERWGSGKGFPPEGVFLRVVDILEEQPRPRPPPRGDEGKPRTL